MTIEDRKVEICDRVERAITQLRLIRSRVVKGVHVDPSDIESLRGLVDSLRHGCEMHNQERLQK